MSLLKLGQVLILISDLPQDPSCQALPLILHVSEIPSEIHCNSFTGIDNKRWRIQIIFGYKFPMWKWTLKPLRNKKFLYRVFGKRFLPLKEAVDPF